MPTRLEAATRTHDSHPGAQETDTVARVKLLSCSSTTEQFESADPLVAGDIHHEVAVHRDVVVAGERSGPIGLQQNSAWLDGDDQPGATLDHDASVSRRPNRAAGRQHVDQPWLLTLLSWSRLSVHGEHLLGGCDSCTPLRRRTAPPRLANASQNRAMQSAPAASPGRRLSVCVRQQLRACSSAPTFAIE